MFRKSPGRAHSAPGAMEAIVCPSGFDVVFMTPREYLILGASVVVTWPFPEGLLSSASNGREAPDPSFDSPQFPFALLKVEAFEGPSKV